MAGSKHILMTHSEKSFMKVGKVGTTYGVHGWIKIHSFTEFGPSILDYTPWYFIDDQETYTPITLEEGKVQGKTVMVKFAGINTPEEARLLTGKLIAIPRSELPPLQQHEYYWSDLVGLTVINQNGDTLGKVIYLIETGSNDVLVVKGEREHAVPYLMGDVILSIDLAKGEIQVDWEPIL
jgi:16S rRNA processing protein RimM